MLFDAEYINVRKFTYIVVKCTLAFMEALLNCEHVLEKGLTSKLLTAIEKSEHIVKL